MNYNEILDLIYIKKDYSEAKKQLELVNDARSFNMLGKINIQEGSIDKAKYYFNKAQNIIGCTYCHILNENLTEARILASTIKNSSSVIKWLLVIINILDNTEGEYPTYFQIRNFYEQDLELLFKFKKKNYIETIICNQIYFEYFNREIYKYTGRVLFNNGIDNQSEEFLKKSLDIFYNDPETHYLLGELYLKQNRLEEAKKSFKISNVVNTEYKPALNKLKDLLN